MQTMKVDYESLMIERLSAARDAVEQVVKFDAEVAENLVREFQVEVKAMGLYSPYLPTYYCDAGSSHRIRWGKLIWNTSKKKVTAMNPAPKNDNGDYLIANFVVGDKKLKNLMATYEDKFRVLRSSIKQNRVITKSLTARIAAIRSGKKKIILGEVSVSTDNVDVQVL